MTSNAYQVRDLIERVYEEMGNADELYGPFTSSHEGLGVLIEEVEELREAIRSNDLDAIEAEAIQVAAVAIRLAEACEDSAFRIRSRGGAVRE